MKKVAMVNRRSHDEQQEPFVLGEMITLRDQPGAAAPEGEGEKDE